MSGAVISLMEPRHLDEVLVIENASFSSPWTRESLSKDLTENERAVYIVATIDGAVVGYAGMWHIVNEGHITNVAVKEGQRRTGIGDILVDGLVAEAISRDIFAITLETRVSNAAAQKLYAKHGFKPEGFRKGYYADDREDAVIMWKYLNK